MSPPSNRDPEAIAAYALILSLALLTLALLIHTLLT